MSEVLFFDYGKDENPLRGLERLFSRSGFDREIPGGRRVALKLHMGELGNIRYLRPIFARKVVDIVRGKGGDPFLFDTVVNYPGSRETREKYLLTAAMNGFAESGMNAPVVICDDTDEMKTIPLYRRIDGCEIDKVRVPMPPLQASCLIVLSHVKGHDLTGFGGALKNLGMGCVSRDTKRAQHLVNMPQFDEDAGCDGCGVCAESCPTGAITMAADRPQRASAECTACGTCWLKCPAGCWIIPPGGKEKLQVCLAHSAGAVLSARQGPVAFVNFIQDVVPHCDCAAPSGSPIVQDVGIAFSTDPVAVDKASLDLIDRAPLIPGATSVRPPDILGKMYNTNSLVQLDTAEKLGIGELRYDLIEV
jgi:uncharacterized Fe-S center protein